MSDDERERLANWWRWFGESECRGYAPLYEDICSAVAANDDVLSFVMCAPGEAWQPNVLLAAAHDLVLRGVDHPLSSLYGARERGEHGDGDPGALFCDLVLRHRDEIAPLLETRRTNTNECGRSAVLVPALRWAADQVGEPIALLDAGASAGLNLAVDQYLIDYGDGRTVGPASSPVRIECAVAGDPPVGRGCPEIVARAGLDRSPVDLSDDDAARWLLACTWPGTGRLRRTAAAIEMAKQWHHDIVQGDLVDGFASAVAVLPAAVPIVVTTTWVMAYLPLEARPAFAERLAATSADRPVVWVRAEGPHVVDDEPPDAPPEQATAGGIRPSILGATVYRDGTAVHTRVLGRCHPHGAALDWF